VGSYWKLLSDVEKVFNIIFTRHPAPFRVLEDAEGMPSPDEVLQMIACGGENLGCRVDGGEMVPEAQRRMEIVDWFFRVVSDAGGWGHLVECCREFRNFLPEEWNTVCLHVRYVRPGGTFHSGDGGALARVARVLGVSVDTVLRRRLEVPRQLARLALLDHPEGAKNLLRIVPGTKGAKDSRIEQRLLF